MNHRAYREHRPPTSLARHLGESGMDQEHVREAARAAWRKRGVGVFLPDDLQRLPPIARKLIEGELVRLYGVRR